MVDDPAILPQAGAVEAVPGAPRRRGLGGGAGRIGRGILELLGGGRARSRTGWIRRWGS